MPETENGTSKASHTLDNPILGPESPLMPDASLRIFIAGVGKRVVDGVDDPRGKHGFGIVIEKKGEAWPIRRIGFCSEKPGTTHNRAYLGALLTSLGWIGRHAAANKVEILCDATYIVPNFRDRREKWIAKSHKEEVPNIDLVIPTSIRLDALGNNVTISATGTSSLCLSRQKDASEIAAYCRDSWVSGVPMRGGMARTLYIPYRDLIAEEEEDLDEQIRAAVARDRT